MHLKAFLSQLTPLQIILLGLIKSFHVQEVGRFPSEDVIKVNSSFHLLVECWN